MRKSRHRLDQLIDLRTEQRLAIACFNRLCPIDVLVYQFCTVTIRRAMNRQPEIVRLPADDEIQRIDSTVEQHLVGRAASILH